MNKYIVLWGALREKGKSQDVMTWPELLTSNYSRFIELKDGNSSAADAIQAYMDLAVEEVSRKVQSARIIVDILNAKSPAEFPWFVVGLDRSSWDIASYDAKLSIKASESIVAEMPATCVDEGEPQ